VIDLRTARNDAEGYRRALARKAAADAFDELLAADEAKRAVQTKVEELRARTKLKGRPTPEQLEELTAIKGQLQPLEQELASAETRVQELLDRVPNPPADDTPDGDQEEDAVTVRTWGEPPSFDFTPKDHLDLAGPQGLGLIDPERLTVTGVEQARGLVARRPSNALIERAGKECHLASVGASGNRQVFDVHR